jgi:hypothetical protein
MGNLCLIIYSIVFNLQVLFLFNCSARGKLKLLLALCGRAGEGVRMPEVALLPTQAANALVPMAL